MGNIALLGKIDIHSPSYINRIRLFGLSVVSKKKKSRLDVVGIATP
jgi:hypothetical protein